MASWRCVSVWRTNWELFMNILNNFDICWVANYNSRSRQTVNRFCSWRIASWGIKTTKLYTIIYHLRLDCADIFSSLSSYLPLCLSPCLNSLRFSFVSFRFVRLAVLCCFAPSFVVDICRNRAPRIIFRFAYHKVDWVSAIKTKARNAKCWRWCWWCWTCLPLAMLMIAISLFLIVHRYTPTIRQRYTIATQMLIHFGSNRYFSLSLLSLLSLSLCFGWHVPCAS